MRPVRTGSQEDTLKTSRIIAALALALSGIAAPAIVEAKSVKWACYALDPSNPFNLTCYPSTSRP